MTHVVLIPFQIWRIPASSSCLPLSPLVPLIQSLPLSLLVPLSAPLSLSAPCIPIFLFTVLLPAPALGTSVNHGRLEWVVRQLLGLFGVHSSSLTSLSH